MISILRSDSTNKDFQILVKELDKELSIRDGDDHGFYDQYNKIDNINHTVIVYDNLNPVGCGAIKQYDENTMEVKRMFVPLNNRKKGIASIILKELESWSKEMNFEKCILETGKAQPEAIQLYYKNNYSVIPNYGQYVGIDNSVCFEKIINP